MTTAEFVKNLWKRFGRMPRAAIPALVGYHPHSQTYRATYPDRSLLMFRAADVLPGLTSLNELDFVVVKFAHKGHFTGRRGYVYLMAVKTYQVASGSAETARITLNDGRGVEIMRNPVLCDAVEERGEHRERTGQDEQRKLATA